LKYWTAGGAEREIEGRVVGNRREAVIDGLAPGTEYKYQVADASHTFRTAGRGRTPFLVIGDTGTGSPEQAALAQLLAKEEASLLVHTGDVAYPVGNTEAYEQRYLDYYHAIMPRVPFFPCPGNHDYYETGAAPYFALHDLPRDGVHESEHGRYYSFEWGDATFISIDSNDPLNDPVRRARMLTWLDKTLTESDRFWRIVYFHHPPFASGPNEEDSLTALARQHIVPILEKHHVPVIFNGHEHSYQRSKPVKGAVYYTSGGGGAPLYPIGAGPTVAHGVSANHYLRAAIADYRLRVEAVGLDGKTFDTSAVTPRPFFRRNGVVNAASFETRIGKGSPVSIFGWQLGMTGRNDITVEANGRPLELLAVSANQVNAALPMDLSGAVTLRLTTPNGTDSAEIEVADIAPALFNTPEPGPVLYATGLVDWNGPLTVKLGAAEVEGRLYPGPVAGVQRIEFTVPSSLSMGPLDASVRAGQFESNTVRVMLR
jgi:predicted MPP superfamily phosphohydrolase